MTTIQKTVVATTVAFLAGAVIYQPQQASRLRDQNPALQEQLAPLAGQIQQLELKRDDAASRVVSVVEQTARKTASAAGFRKADEGISKQIGERKSNSFTRLSETGFGKRS